MEEEQNNYFSSPLIFKIIIAPPPTPQPDLETYLILLSGRGVKFLKNGANVDLFAPNFSNDFFWKLGASKSTLAPFKKDLTPPPENMAKYVSKSGGGIWGEDFICSKINFEQK